MANIKSHSNQYDTFKLYCNTQFELHSIQELIRQTCVKHSAGTNNLPDASEEIKQGYKSITSLV